MGDRHVDIVSTFDTSGVQAGADKGAAAIKKLDKSVKATRFDTAHIDKYNKRLDQLAKKKIQISVDEKGLGKAEAQVKRMMKDIELAQAMANKAGYWKDYHKTRLDYQAKGKGDEFAQKFAPVRKALAERDVAEQKKQQAAQQKVTAAKQEAADKEDKDTKDKDKEGKKTKAKGISARMISRIGKVAAGSAGSAFGPLAGIAQGVGPGAAGGIAAAVYAGSKVLPSLKYMMDDAAKSTTLFGFSLQGVDKWLTKSFDHRSQNSVARMKDELEKLTGEIDWIESKGRGGLAGDKFGEYQQKLNQRIGMTRNIAGRERGRGAYLAAATSPESLAERNDQFQGQRAEYLGRQIGPGDVKPLQDQLAAAMNKGLKDQFLMAQNSQRAERVVGEMILGIKEAAQEVADLLKGTKFGGIVAGGLNNQGMARESITRGREAALPQLLEQSKDHIADLQREEFFGRAIMKTGDYTIQQKQRQLELVKQETALKRAGFKGDDLKNAMNAAERAMIKQDREAVQNQTQDLREQNDLQAKLLQKYDGSTKYAQQMAEIERQHLIDVKNVGKAAADDLEIQRKRAVETEKTTKFTRETQAHNRGMAFNKMPGMSLEQQARHPELFNRMKGLEERGFQEGWKPKQLQLRKQQAHEEAIMEKRRSTASTAYLETRTPQENLRNQLGELMGAAGMLGGPATMDQNTMQRKMMSMAIERKDRGTTGWGAVEAGTSGAYEAFAKSQNEGANIQAAMLEQLRIMASLLQQARGQSNARPDGPVRGLAAVGGNQPGAQNPPLGLGGAY